jgi:hypothetical protein
MAVAAVEQAAAGTEALYNERSVMAVAAVEQAAAGTEALYNERSKGSRWYEASEQ